MTTALTLFTLKLSSTNVKTRGRLKPPRRIPAFCIRVLVPVLAPSLPIHLPVDASQEAANAGRSSWAPATHMEELDRVLGSWLRLGQAITDIWGLKDLSFFLIFLSMPFK